ncbi:MAG: peptidase M24 [Spirochaetes bacterium]|nr:peptidase M24 [Spirochaetota bacterium]
MFVNEEIKEKKVRLRSLMKELNLDGIYLKKQSNFSWLTCGGLNVVGITLELGVAGLLITKDNEFALCNNIESPRMILEEKLEQQGYQVINYPWFTDRETELIQKIMAGGNLGADHIFPFSVNISNRINSLRYSLTPWEIERYKELGVLTSLAIEETAKDAKPGEKECAVVGKLSQRLWENRIDYITTFCAADDRISLFRHPIATENRIKKRMMLCVNARKYGLVVSLTRFVQFGKIPKEIRKIYDANVLIDCTFMANTVPGEPVSYAFNKGIDAYKNTGYPEEYKLHHQGGAIGYVGRDYKVDFETKEIVQENQAFAWNPSITGSKSEDTMIATNDGPVLLTIPRIFPELKIQVDNIAFSRPDILVL